MGKGLKALAREPNRASAWQSHHTMVAQHAGILCVHCGRVSVHQRPHLPRLLSLASPPYLGWQVDSSPLLSVMQAQRTARQPPESPMAFAIWARRAVTVRLTPGPQDQAQLQPQHHRLCKLSLLRLLLSPLLLPQALQVGSRELHTCEKSSSYAHRRTVYQDPKIDQCGRSGM